jgi:hypothetical protein
VPMPDLTGSIEADRAATPLDVYAWLTEEVAGGLESSEWVQGDDLGAIENQEGVLDFLKDIGGAVVSALPTILPGVVSAIKGAQPQPAQPAQPAAQPQPAQQPQPAAQPQPAPAATVQVPPGDLNALVQQLAQLVPLLVQLLAQRRPGEAAEAAEPGGGGDVEPDIEISGDYVEEVLATEEADAGWDWSTEGPEPTAGVEPSTEGAPVARWQ